MKLNQLVDKTDNPKHIYPVREALMAVVEVIKLNKKEGDEPPKNTFFTDIMKLISDDDGNKS